MCVRKKGLDDNLRTAFDEAGLFILENVLNNVGKFRDVLRITNLKAEHRRRIGDAIAARQDTSL
jgi:hypothetical protein